MCGEVCVVFGICLVFSSGLRNFFFVGVIDFCVDRWIFGYSGFLDVINLILKVKDM